MTARTYAAGQVFAMAADVDGALHKLDSKSRGTDESLEVQTARAAVLNGDDVVYLVRIERVYTAKTTREVVEATPEPTTPPCAKRPPPPQPEGATCNWWAECGEDEPLDRAHTRPETAFVPPGSSLRTRYWRMIKPNAPGPDVLVGPVFRAASKPAALREVSDANPTASVVEVHADGTPL